MTNRLDWAIFTGLIAVLLYLAFAPMTIVVAIILGFVTGFVLVYGGSLLIFWD